MITSRILRVTLAIASITITVGCAGPQRDLEQLPIAPMLGHPYHSSHGFEPRWGEPLSVQTF